MFSNSTNDSIINNRVRLMGFIKFSRDSHGFSFLWIAARIVTGGTRLVSLSNLYIETGWEKLKDRRERHRTIQFYKMSNNLTPQYLSNLIPQNFGMIHDHNTRHTVPL
jgi:hypothetical protein